MLNKTFPSWYRKVLTMDTKWQCSRLSERTYLEWFTSRLSERTYHERFTSRLSERTYHEWFSSRLSERTYLEWFTSRLSERTYLEWFTSRLSEMTYLEWFTPLHDGHLHVLATRLDDFQQGLQREFDALVVIGHQLVCVVLLKELPNRLGTAANCVCLKT